MPDLRRMHRGVAVGTGLALAAVGIVASLSLGSNHVPLGRVLMLLATPDGTPESDVIRGLRVPRTVVALVVGAALAIAGTLMQALTRNPLADPGILGVNAGAALAVVTGVAVTGITGIWFFLWLALAGAAAASVGVYLLAGSGHETVTPSRVALAGVAVSAALAAITQTVILADQQAFNEFRFWVSGSLEGRGWGTLAAIAPVLIPGLVLAILLGPALNALALGDDTGHALGADVSRIRILTMVAITLLAGGATAAVGPIVFVGLAVPLAARALGGTDQRWLTVLCLVLGPAWMLLADTIARLVLAPQEAPTGVVAALIGAPVFIAVIRGRRVAAL